MHFTNILITAFAVCMVNAAALADGAMGDSQSNNLDSTEATAFSEHATLTRRANVIERQNPESKLSTEFLASLNWRQVHILYDVLQDAYNTDLKALRNPNDEMERRAIVALSILKHANQFSSLEPFEAQALYLYLEALRTEMLKRSNVAFSRFPNLFR